MPFVEVKQSGPDIPDGAWPVILTAITGDKDDANAPRHVIPEQGPNAGKDLYFWDWTFKINVPGGHQLDGTEIEYSTSTNSGSKSNMYKLLTALLNGIAPTVGASFEKADLIGRMALASIQRDPSGFCRITAFMAMPASMQQQAFAAATAAPLAPQAPAAAPVAPAAPPAAAALPIQQIVPPQPAGALPNQVPDAAQFQGPPPAAPVQPLREQVAAGATGDDLPF